MKNSFSSFFHRYENLLLQTLLARFVIRQISAPYWGSSELVDCATVLIDEVLNEDC